MDFDKYKPALEYPMPDKSLPTADEIEVGLRRGWLAQPAPLSQEEDLKLRRRAWNSLKSALEDQFERDALEEVGLTDHPKARKVYALAYDYGHSGGYREVFSHLVDLAALVRD